MPQTIQIKAGSVTLTAELNDSATATAIAAALPIRATVQRWGDEIYFRIPVSQSQAADARAEMAVGELAYWPPGEAFCIFFGRTPASRDDRPCAASRANPIGKVEGDATLFRQVKDGTGILLEKA